ncbi:MFS transporter [Anoxybacter fermentans]|uniref:MFS transporter n=1 Tax=Anoxybacter fermentans TaxID=1323375 RepID=A0A3Q9HSE5_9FIRM|nr:MFS transporter [Anoxybacter fermentans]AZR74243.1 MFS transporter [Anoxybacter fermentans]
MKFQQNLDCKGEDQKKKALQFIFLLGIVSLFGDITYEGARSIAGPYLAVLGASASIVGLVAGLGEFIGYALRLISGYLADRTGKYWVMTIIGYGLIFSIPLLAFAGYWQLAAVLIILERMGKAIRTPARDAILSHATKQVGRGWGFGIHEALDQVGAIIGPLIFSTVFLLKGGYREGFTILWIPALLTLAILIIARIKVPAPEKLETSGIITRQNLKGKGKLPTVFWFYVLFTSLSVMGFASFQLISFHLKVQSVFSDIQIPIFYAIAMGVDALVALIIGKTYDKIGLRILIMIPLLTLPIPFIAFSRSYILAVMSVILWGAVMGIHETIMRASIADLTPIEHRGFAYGIFNTAYGASWFIGSVLMGLLYDFSVKYLILFVVIIEVISVLVFFMVKKMVLLAGKNIGR